MLLNNQVLVILINGFYLCVNSGLHLWALSSLIFVQPGFGVQEAEPGMAALPPGGNSPYMQRITTEGLTVPA